MRYILAFSLILALYSCKQESADQLFIPLPNITDDILLKQGYERVWGIDMVTYEKKVNDIIFIYYFYDSEGQRLGNQTWVYESVSLNTNEEYDRKLRALGFHPITPVDLNERVAVSSDKTNLVYISLFFPKDNELRISYEHLSIKK